MNEAINNFGSVRNEQPVEDAVFAEMTGLEIQPFLMGAYRDKDFTADEAKEAFENARPNDWAGAGFEGGLNWLVTEGVLSYDEKSGTYRFQVNEEKEQVM